MSTTYACAQVLSSTSFMYHYFTVSWLTFVTTSLHLLTYHFAISLSLLISTSVSLTSLNTWLYHVFVGWHFGLITARLNLFISCFANLRKMMQFQGGVWCRSSPNNPTYLLFLYNFCSNFLLHWFDQIFT